MLTVLPNSLAHVRHRLLSAFALIGSLLTISFVLLPSNSSIWTLCVLIAVGANVSFGASIVCLNSYCPSAKLTEAYD